MTESERRKALVERLTVIRSGMEEIGERAAPFVLVKDEVDTLLAALASCPTVEQREQALQVARGAGRWSAPAEAGIQHTVYMKLHDEAMAEARRLLGLAPTGE